MSARGERIWRGFAVLAACVYLVAMFAPWQSGCYRGKSWPGALASTATRACGGWASVLGIASIVLCYLILVFALLCPRRSALSLEPLRTALSLGLVALTVLVFLESFWRLTGWNESALIWRSVLSRRAGYGAWAALGSSLALLLAVAVLDTGDLNKLLDHLPAWARLDRLEEPEEAARAKPVASNSERSHRRWTGVLVLALIAYILSLSANWWWYSGGQAGDSSKGELTLLNLFSGVTTTHLDGFAGIGEFCALAALATLIVASLARSGREHRLKRLRNRLVAFLVGLTLVDVLVVWRQTYDVFRFTELSNTRSRPDYGTLATLVSILVILLATLVLNAGGWTKVLDRLRSSARAAPLEEPPEGSEETT